MNDVALEKAEDSYKDQRRKEACLEAALLIAEEMPRAQAIRKVSDHMSARDDAIQSENFVVDPHGNVESFLDTVLDRNPLQYKNPAQIKAIAIDLYASDAFANEA